MLSTTHTEGSPIPASSRRWQRRIGWMATTLAFLGICALVRYNSGTEPASAQTAAARRSSRATGRPQVAPTKRKTPESKSRQRIPDPVAVVNGQEYRRAELENSCMLRHGKEVLEGMVNKHLVTHHCRRRNITVSDAEIDAEINRIAERFSLSRDQYLDLLVRERGVNLNEYRHDTVWAMLALRKLAADQLVPTGDELRTAYETQYGPQVRARLIVVEDGRIAQQLHAQLVANPKEFARLAIERSTDVNSASIGGLIQPIRHHIGDPAIEQAVFRLQNGQISPIIRVGNQFAILKCEGHIPARQIQMAAVQNELIERIKEEKLRDVASELFATLQKSATVKNVYNDPTLRQRMPGVVATVNGDSITVRELGEQCTRRHGTEVLQIEIGHMLLAQSLRAAGLNITDQDLNGEITHAAILSGVVDSEGKPDLKKWMKMATTERDISRDVYLRDSVWPSAALKKLTGGTVNVSDEDLNKAFEANHGERVRCRAIVMTNHRKAQQVWDMARKNPTTENFAELAAEYSIEPTSSSLRGEIPPIRRFGGQPKIEAAAFSLQPGQVSGILQMGDKSVILFCEGRTKPVEIRFEEVRHILHQDIFEKKLRRTMGERFEQMHESAQIDNYLAGTSQSPKKRKKGQQASNRRRDPAVKPAAAQRR